MSTILSLSDDRRAEVERELVAPARAAALGELAAGVAHDVANPLYGVLGLVDLLLEDAAAGSNDEARLRLVQQAALEMKSTLRVLLDFARPADGGPAQASLDDAVREALVLLRHGAERSLEVAEKSYKAGAISLLELLEAQRTFLETRAQYLRAKYDYRQSRVDLRRAVGSDWK